MRPGTVFMTEHVHPRLPVQCQMAVAPPARRHHQQVAPAPDLLDMRVPAVESCNHLLLLHMKYRLAQLRLNLVPTLLCVLRITRLEQLLETL
eukprot:COSAG06_NODE_46300_length_348_cov_0.566265_1_plen_91_part_10